MFYVKHRAAQEMCGNGQRPPDLEWEYDGPFDTFAEAKTHWDNIRPNWQEGGVAKKCRACGEYSWVKEEEHGTQPTNG